MPLTPKHYWEDLLKLLVNIYVTHNGVQIWRYLTRRSLGDYFCLPPNPCLRGAFTSISHLSQSSGLVFSLALSPSLWLHTAMIHSAFQAALKPLHMFALMWKELNVLSLRFFPFCYSFICLYIFKMFTVVNLCLELLLMKLLSPDNQTHSSWWWCLIKCFKTSCCHWRETAWLTHPHSGVSAAHLFNLVHLKCIVHFCYHLNDLSIFFSFFICIFKVFFQTFTARPPSSPWNRSMLLAPFYRWG